MKMPGQGLKGGKEKNKKKNENKKKNQNKKGG